MATRPSGQYERTPEPAFGEIIDEPGGGALAGAAPWLALLAVVLAAGALAFVVLGRGSGGDLTACRTAAWSAVPDPDNLPPDWQLGSTDLNVNGMTISILGPVPADSSTNQPVIYATVTCYGDAASAALAQNRKTSVAVGATVTNRAANGEAYDIDNPTTGSVTTLFRVGGLVGQVADGGTANPDDLAVITSALAAAMGDGTAAGKAHLGPSDAPGASDEPIGSDDVGAGDSSAPFAPDLEALLPTSVTDTSSTASPPAAIPLSVVSASGTDVFGNDPNSRALAARVRSLGATLDQLQVARASDDSGVLDLLVTAFRLPKTDLAKLKAAVTETWLGAGADGVKTTTVNLGGKSVTKVDYGDGSTIDYVYAKDDYVIVIDTSDADVATEVASHLK